MRRQKLKKAFSCADQSFEVLPVICFEQIANGIKDLRLCHPFVHQGNFLQTGNLEALAGFDGSDEIGGVQKGFMGARVKPGVSSAEADDAEVAAAEIGVVDVCDLQFASGGRL